MGSLSELIGRPSYIKFENSIQISEVIRVSYQKVKQWYL